MPTNHLNKLKGYYLIPHELLHVWGYRIIGKPCHYEWGACRVIPLAHRTRNERLFIGLLPLAVSWGIGFTFHFLWLLSVIFWIQIPIERYLIDGPTWHLIFVLLGSVFVIYGGTAHADLINAYYLLFGENYSKESNEEQHGQSDDQKIQRNNPQTANRNVSFVIGSGAFKKNALKSRIAGNSQKKQHSYDDIE
ncbi:hypothetical protein QUF64_09150 [Anaerolineales bacterium HSG6]|nr:hypothetical protein [Anaerolineales bacterium HSG6]